MEDADDPRRSLRTTDARDTLLAFLAAQRTIVVEKSTGLSDADAAKRLVPSLTSVSGVIRHLADVERSWFVETFAGLPYERAFGSDDDPDGEWKVSADDSLAAIIADYEASWAESDAAIAGRSFDDFAANAPIPLVWIVTHMIEETARHLGHIDILREQLDGVTGE